jgi:hypothetical protein
VYPPDKGLERIFLLLVQLKKLVNFCRISKGGLDAHH